MKQKVRICYASFFSSVGVTKQRATEAPSVARAKIDAVARTDAKSRDSAAEKSRLR